MISVRLQQHMIFGQIEPAELELMGLVPSWQARHNAFPKYETADPHKFVTRKLVPVSNVLQHAAREV